MPLVVSPSVSHSFRYSWIRKINDTLSPRGSPHHVVILSTPKDLRSHLWPGFTTGQSQSHEGRTSVFLPSSSSPPSRYSEIPQYFPNSRFQFCRLLVPFHFFEFPRSFLLLWSLFSHGTTSIYWVGGMARPNLVAKYRVDRDQDLQWFAHSEFPNM